MAKDTIYLKSPRGQVESFEEFRRKLQKLGTPEKMRFREIKRMLNKEAQPLVTAARKYAYKDGLAKGEHVYEYDEKKGKDVVKFYNLYRSIGKFTNKRNKFKAYVVVGLRTPNNKGAIYGLSQLAGAGPGGPAKRPKKVGVGRGQTASGDAQYTIQPKDFVEKGLGATNVDAKIIKSLTRHIDKVLQTL